MILLDDRIGAIELQTILGGLCIDYKVQRLEAGDLAFEGHGPKGTGMVVVERKRLGDMLSSIQSGRFSGVQVPKLVKHEFPYLIVEGTHRIDPQTEMLQTPVHGGWRDFRTGSRSWRGSELYNFLTTIERKTPIRYRFTSTPTDTVLAVKMLQSWFAKDWDGHHAYTGFYNPDPGVISWDLRKPSLLRRWAKELPFVGWVRSRDVERRFRSPLEMAIAGIDEWMLIPGIGRGIAAKIVQWIAGEGDEDAQGGD